MSREIAISKFKAEVLGLLDEISHSGEELVVTKRGRPIATVHPVAEPAPLRGSVEFLVPDEELVGPLGDRWEADRR